MVLLFVVAAGLFASNISLLSAQLQNIPGKELVVLLHGLGRGKSMMVPLKEQLETSGYAVTIVDYRSIGRSPDEILKNVSEQISSFRTDTFRVVHFAGHSLGGLLIRAYLDSVKLPNLGRVVLIGSPSKGTPFVDHFRDAWWLKLVGQAAMSLGTDSSSLPRKLRAPYYPVGVIAGISTAFNNDDFIPGDDDGMVPVESTKIEGMTDFILLKVSHSALPKNETVMGQTIEFLKNGKFIPHSSAK